MTIALLARCGPGEIRIVAADGDRLIDHAIWRPGAPDGFGDLHLGRIETVLPALGGAFVALAGMEPGFLPLRDNGDRRPGVGDAVPVRVARSAQAGKGPRLRLVPDDGHHREDAPRLLERGPDPVTVLAAMHGEAAILADDPALAADMLPGLRTRIRPAGAAMSEALLARIEALGDPAVALPGGLRATIQPTAALVAIDVDGAGSSAGRQGKAQAQFAANHAAIGPLLHQLRLRNLSGAILIDLAGLPSRKRPALRPEIEAALALDPLGPRLLGFTALGLLEILRPRERPPLHELLAGPHAAGLAALRAALLEVAAPPHRLPFLAASPAVAAALDGDQAARGTLAARAGQPIRVRVDTALPEPSWRLEDGSSRGSTEHRP